MTALMIIAAIIAVIVILLYFPVTAEVSYMNKEARLRVKYLIFTVYSIPVKKKKTKKKKNPKKEKKSEKDKGRVPEGEDDPEELPVKEKKERSSDSTSEIGKLSDEDEKLLNPDRSSEKQKKSPSEIMDEIRDYKRIILLAWGLVKKNFLKICKCVRIDGVEIDLTAAGEDAFEASMLYGRLHAALWNIIAFTGSFIPLSVKRADIKINYNTDEPQYALKAKIRIIPAVIIGNVIAAAFKLLIHMKEIKGKDVNDGHKS